MQLKFGGAKFCKLLIMDLTTMRSCHLGIF